MCIRDRPINDPKFLSSSKNVPLANLMQSHPQPEKPIALFETGTGAMKFAFAPVVFDKSQRMYVAAFGQGDIASAEFGSKGFQHGISSITTSKSSTHPGSLSLIHI